MTRGPGAPGDDWVALVAAILRGAPKLPRAACRGKAGLFDAAEGSHQVRRARTICLACPELEACKTWAATQRDLVGVAAGQFRGTVRRDDDDNETPSEAAND